VPILLNAVQIISPGNRGRDRRPQSMVGKHVGRRARYLWKRPNRNGPGAAEPAAPG